MFLFLSVLISDKKMIAEMSKTVLNHDGGFWRSTNTYLICMIDGEQEPIKIKNLKRNDSREIKGIHADEILIDKLKRKSCSNTAITVYINNSPCYSCARSLKKFVDDNNIRLTLYVTSLYYIARNSCLERKEQHFFSNINTGAVYWGLRHLMRPGLGHCTIEAFTKKVWGKLLDALDFSETDKDRFFFKYDRKSSAHDRSRKTEDIRIKKDLNYIKTLSLSKYENKLKSD